MARPQRVPSAEHAKPLAASAADDEKNKLKNVLDAMRQNKSVKAAAVQNGERFDLFNSSSSQAVQRLSKNGTVVLRLFILYTRFTILSVDWERLLRSD